MHAQWEGTSARAPAFPFNKLHSAAADIICEYFSMLEQAGYKLTIKDKKRGKKEIKSQKEENTLKLKYKIAHHCGFPVTRILGQSEILIYLFYSVSHFTFTSSGAFHITLCSRMYPLFPPGD